MSIRTSVEAARGCGYRKPGGYYLVAPQLSEPCPRLPIELDRCPHCGQGIGPARGFTWVTPHVLFPARPHGVGGHNDWCPLGTPDTQHVERRNEDTGTVTWSGPAWAETEYTEHRMGERAGLIWVGGLYYPTPESFMEEAAQMGVSRRIKAPPRGFKVGEHWIALGHRKAVRHNSQERGETVGELLDFMEDEPAFTPGIITVFRPTAIEYIVKGDETDEEIEALEKRGISPVKVIRDIRLPEQEFAERFPEHAKLAEVNYSVDLTKLEEEKRQMLEDIREANARA